MSQYTVMLVDDEEEVFQIMIKKLEWDKMGFEIVGYARNGVEALEMAETLQPDVVLTDIKMPFMDGLTLSKKLKELYPKIKIIILSGFDEFVYAKEAIKLEAEEYILKPINAMELKEVFERVKKNLDNERDEKRNIDKLKKYYMESLPMLQDSFCTLLIEGRIPTDQISDYLANYQIQLHGPNYIVTVLHISKTDKPENIQPFLLVVSVKKLAEEQLMEKWNSRVITYLGDIIIISQFKECELVTEYIDDMDTFCKVAKRLCNVKLTAGIGHSCNKIQDLPISYRGAQNALSYRILYGNVRAISIAEIDPQENTDIPWEEQYYNKIFRKIKTGSRQDLKVAVHNCINQFSGKGISLQKYRISIMELIVELCRFAHTNQLNMEEILGECKDVYGQVLQMESPQELEEWLIAVVNKVQDIILNERQDTTRSFIAKGIVFVKEHYSDQNLTVETVCKHLGVSASYFSVVFKKETGKTFINYLTDYRMEKALDLLLYQDEKTYIIAEKVGYSDPNYFSYVFKKQFGVSPSKYKLGRTN